MLLPLPFILDSCGTESHPPAVPRDFSRTPDVLQVDLFQFLYFTYVHGGGGEPVRPVGMDPAHGKCVTVVT